MHALDSKTNAINMAATQDNNEVGIAYFLTDVFTCQNQYGTFTS